MKEYRLIRLIDDYDNKEFAIVKVDKNLTDSKIKETIDTIKEQEGSYYDIANAIGEIIEDINEFYI